jgi:hypothetical protein
LGRSLLRNACYEGRSALVRTLLKFSVDIWKEVELTCGNEETTQILNMELKKSVKHQKKIQRLQAIDKKMLAKVIRVDCSDKILILLRFPPLIQKNFNESRLSMYNWNFALVGILWREKVHTNSEVNLKATVKNVVLFLAPDWVFRHRHSYSRHQN